ncbi:MAG: response regulator [FCB group bacterium]|nr:response regulator [FCB group bacterium]
MIISERFPFDPDLADNFIERYGSFELWYDRRPFPFLIRKFHKITENEESGTITVELMTDLGAEIIQAFKGIGEHELEIVELKDLSPGTREIKALLIDDDEVIVDILEAILMGIGIEDISLAFNGESALQAYKDTKPDIVFSDYRMPDMDGLQLLQKLRSLEYEGPVVMFSGHYARLVDKVKKEEIKPDFIFPKPFRRSDIVNVLKVCFPDMVDDDEE